MNVVSYIIVGVMALFTTWLLIDTIVGIVRKVRAKKKADKNKVVDETETK